MVFKAVAGNGKEVYDLYRSDRVSAELVRRALDVTNNYNQEHYKNRILSSNANWASFNPTKVSVG